MIYRVVFDVVLERDATISIEVDTDDYPPGHFSDEDDVIAEALEALEGRNPDYFIEAEFDDEIKGPLSHADVLECREVV